MSQTDEMVAFVTEEAAEVDKEGFVKGLRLLDAITLVIGTMIGSGIFIVSADITRIVQSPGLMLTVWAIAGVLTIIAALSFAELAAAMPKAGGQYIFLREAYGKLPAFLYGWTFFFVMSTGILAAVSIAFAKFLGVLWPAISASNIIFHAGFVKVSTQQLVAICVIAVLSYINCRGVREGAVIQNVFTVLKVFAVIMLAMAGLTIGRDPAVISQNFSGMFSSPVSGFSIATAIGASMVGAMFAMDSWAYVCSAAAEVENPRKNLPRALIIGTGVVVMLYLLVNIAYMSVLPLLGTEGGADIMARGVQFASEDRVATAVAQTMFGSTGLYLIAGAIMISTFGCVNGNILTGSRTFYAMAKDGLFFKAAGRISPKTHVPVTAIVVGGIWGSLLTLSGSYSELLDYIIFAAMLFYIFTVLAVFVLRKKKPDMPRPYKAWGYPWLPIIYIIAASLICVDLLIYKPTYTWPGLIIVCSGFPAYYIWRWIEK